MATPWLPRPEVLSGIVITLIAAAWLRFNAAEGGPRVAALRAFFRFAVDEGFVTTDPAENLALPKRWKTLPKALTDLQPVPDSLFLSADGRGGRASGGLFSLDGVHPTTVAYGVMAQELANIMVTAGVQFDRAQVDFDRLVRRDTLVRTPPQNLDSTLGVIGWADEHLGFAKRVFGL